MEGQLSLLDLMRPPVLRLPVDWRAAALQGDPQETLRFPSPPARWLESWIELHPGSRGWMWGLHVQLPYGGGGFRVGEKWGLFAPDRESALAEAVADVLARCALHDRRYGQSAHVRRVRAWAGALR